MAAATTAASTRQCLAGCGPRRYLVDRAYQWYRRAYDLGKSDSPVYWGSAALRLGKAHEEGEGCTQSFQEAKGWYSRAVAGLSAAVREGESWYRGALKSAEAGLARAEQEVSGKY
jgi:TPR repeat protein